MKKISVFATRDDKFHPIVILESDLSQDSKLLFYTLYFLPSKIVPTQEELKKYTSIKSSSKIRKSWKELELRGVVEISSGHVVLKDTILPAPEGEVLPLKGEQKIEPTGDEQKEFRQWFMEEFQKRFNEPYNFVWGKDNLAIKRLLSAYGLKGAQMKAIEAWDYTSPSPSDQRFFQSAGKSIAMLASVASRLIKNQIIKITNQEKWDGHKKTEIKL